jgi:ATP-dependent DNA helicase RecG
MWANTQPSGGVTFLGITDAGKFSGCRHIEQAHLNDLEAVWVLCPDGRLEFKRVATKNANQEDDFILVMRVYYRDDKLVETSSGDAFVREGDRKRRLTEHEKREVRLNKGELDVESERVTLNYPDDFDTGLLEIFHQEYIRKRELQERYSIEDVLNLAKLGKRGPAGFQPNLACALLFARDPRLETPGAYIRVLRYDGIEEQFGRKLNIIADRQIDGPLPLQIAKAQEFINSQIRNFTRLGLMGAL